MQETEEQMTTRRRFLRTAAVSGGCFAGAATLPLKLLAAGDTGGAGGDPERRTNEQAVLEFAVSNRCVSDPLIGRTAPQLNLPLLDGKTFRISDYRGRVLLLLMFAPECPVCYVDTDHFAGQAFTPKTASAKGQGDPECVRENVERIAAYWQKVKRRPEMAMVMVRSDFEHDAQYGSNEDKAKLARRFRDEWYPNLEFPPIAVDTVDRPFQKALYTVGGTNWGGVYIIDAEGRVRLRRPLKHPDDQAWKQQFWPCMEQLVAESTSGRSAPRLSQRALARGGFREMFGELTQAELGVSLDWLPATYPLYGPQFSNLYNWQLPHKYKAQLVADPYAQGPTVGRVADLHVDGLCRIFDAPIPGELEFRVAGSGVLGITLDDFGGPDASFGSTMHTVYNLVYQCRQPSDTQEQSYDTLTFNITESGTRLLVNGREVAKVSEPFAGLQQLRAFAVWKQKSKTRRYDQSVYSDKFVYIDRICFTPAR